MRHKEGRDGESVGSLLTSLVVDRHREHGA